MPKVQRAPCSAPCLDTHGLDAAVDHKSNRVCRAFDESWLFYEPSLLFSPTRRTIVWVTATPTKRPLPGIVN